MTHWTNMTERVTDYLHARRAMGYQLRIEGEELHRFARFATQAGHVGPITTELALDWANAPKNPSDLYRARRLEIVRCLAKYCILFEEDTEIPTKDLMGPAHQRKTPYIFTTKEIDDLIQAAGKLIPKDGLRPLTLQCIFGLLASTGLRVSEALKLTQADVDLDHRLLLVRQTKFTKSRYVPVHATAVKALQVYRHDRNHFHPTLRENAFFLMDNGSPINYRQVLYAFQQIRLQLDWKMSHGRNPRIHDLRHTFASSRLLAWYREGIDLDRALPYLSTYLGHGKVTDTYWYLTGIPELMAIVTERFERFSQQEGGPS